MTTEVAPVNVDGLESFARPASELTAPRKNLSVAVLVDSIAAKYGGPSYSVRRLWQSALKQGVSVTVHSTDSFQARESDEDRRLWQPLDCRRWPAVGLKALGYSNKMADGVAQSLVKGSSVISQHGLWLHYGRVARNLGRKKRAPVIIHPHGMLEPWALRRSSWKKQVTGRLWEFENLRAASCLRVTSTDELRSVRTFGLRNPVALIPHGIDVEDDASLPSAAEAEALLPALKGKRVLLFLSRVHPKKGLKMLLQAWGALGAERRDWQLAIAGPDQGGHTDELKQLADELNLNSSVTFMGALFGEQKLAAYALAELSVLPSFSENFGVAVAEALAAGVPVMTTSGTPWKDLRERGCGWCVEANGEQLAAGLREALSLSTEELAKMGAKGRQWMLRDFSWPRVAAQMIEVCEWTLGGSNATMPGCLILD
ncbi:MAG TPA: glycosyltransferase [Pyrinomonadaceae bacterium]|jgi:glycosyltransferase involved in cell wall biosynthesis